MATPLEFYSTKFFGLGEVNWDRFFSVLSDVGFRGPLCIEAEDQAYEDSQDDRKAALTQSGRSMRNYMS